MSRYIASTDEQDAIDLLTKTGHVVMRRRSHEALMERARRAESLLDSEKENTASVRRWAESSGAEMRRMSDRLNSVVAAAAAKGVSITDINKALLEADESNKDFG